MARWPIRAGLVAAAIAVAPTTPAHAAVTSDIVGGNIVMTGDGDDDLVTIKTIGGALAYDAGSGDVTDWDTAAGGTQNKNANETIFVTFNSGEGDDFLLVVGNGGFSASTLNQDYILHGGGGFDALRVDTTNDTLARTVTLTAGNSSGFIDFAGNTADGDYEHEDVEGVLIDLGSGADTINASSIRSVDSVGVDGNGGNDTMNVGGATGLADLDGRVDFDGGTGTNDTTSVNDGLAAFPGAYLVTNGFANRSGAGTASYDTAVENVTLNASAHADSIFKTATRAVTLNAGAGDDLVSARDSVGDAANCGTGNDFVLSDALDTLADCEASDRTLATPSSPSGGGGSGTTQTVTETITLPAPPGDTTAPTAGLSGVPRTTRLRTLLRGLRGKVTADERASYEVTLLGSTRRVTLARYELTLARQNLPLDLGVRDIRLRPPRRLIGSARRFTVRVVVTPIDAAGNRGKSVARNVKVRR